VPDETTAEQHVRDFARSGVRAGLLSAEELHTEVVASVREQLPDRADRADELADAWLEEAREQLRDEQHGWPEATDYERLQTAFEELQLLDVDVLQGCAGATSVERLLAERDGSGAVPRGVAWFTPADVWHAVDEGLLRVHVWHGTTAPAVEGDELVGDVLGVLEKHGLAARFEDGRLEVDAHWHKRITT
jgi:hypothetical protein